jgi:hypothetical protein
MPGISSKRVTAAAKGAICSSIRPCTMSMSEEPGVSRTGDFGFSYAARWFSNHSHSTSLGVIYPKAE